MTNEEIIISIVRLLGALLVLKWAIVGAIIAIVVDFSDLFLMNLLDLGGVRNYQSLDKWLDLSYMMTFLYVSMKWSRNLLYLSLGLFIFRLFGLLLFEITSNRWLLVIFPNFYEFWFVFAAIAIKFERFRFANKPVLFLIAVLFTLKILQEFTLHGARWLDNYRATDVALSLWQFVLASITR